MNDTIESLEEQFASEFGECPDTQVLIDEHGEQRVMVGYKKVIEQSKRGHPPRSPLPFLKAVIEKLKPEELQGHGRKKRQPMKKTKFPSWVEFAQKVSDMKPDDTFSYEILGESFTVDKVWLTRAAGMVQSNVNLDDNTRRHLNNIVLLLLRQGLKAREYRLARDLFPHDKAFIKLCYEYCYPNKQNTLTQDEVKAIVEQLRAYQKGEHHDEQDN